MAKTNMSKPENNMDCRCSCCCGPWPIVEKVAIVLILPFLFIWALNALFAIGILFTPFTWFASLIVILVFSGKGMKRWRIMGCGCNNGCMCRQCNCSIDQKK